MTSKLNTLFPKKTNNTVKKNQKTNVYFASNCNIRAVAPERAIIIGNNIIDTRDKLVKVENKTQRQYKNINTLNTYINADNISTKTQEFLRTIINREVCNMSNNTREKGGTDFQSVINTVVNNSSDFEKGLVKFSQIMGKTYKDIINIIARNVQSGFNFENNKSDNKQKLYLDIKGMIKLVRGIIALGNNNHFHTDLFGIAIIYELNKYSANEQIFNKVIVSEMNDIWGTSSHNTHLSQVKSILKPFGIINAPENTNRSFSITEEGKIILNALCMNINDIFKYEQNNIIRRYNDTDTKLRDRLVYSNYVKSIIK